jgi:hypothetical protein
MEATETAEIKTDATPSQEAPVNLLGDTTATETTQQQTEQTQVTEEKPAETKVEGAPEKYEFKAPEGKEYDSNVLNAFEAAARESNLTQDAAQKLLDAMTPKIQESQIAQVTAIRREWVESARADKEYGGENLQANLGIAKTAYDRFATPELKSLLDSTGLGSHPEVIRFMYKAGKAISEDTFVSGAAVASRKSSLDVLYPTTAKEQ